MRAFKSVIHRGTHARRQPRSLRTRCRVISPHAPPQHWGGILDDLLVGWVDRLPLITSIASLLYSRLLGQLASDHYPVGLLRRSN